MGAGARRVNVSPERRVIPSQRRPAGEGAAPAGGSNGVRTSSARSADRRQASGARRRITTEQMIVLGIDPGLANTGFGVVERRAGRLVALDGGVVQTLPASSPEQRLGELHEALTDLLRVHEPIAMALESLYFGQNARSAFAVGQARGVAMLCAGQQGVACFSYTPQQVKGAVCGNGRAPKEQVGRMVAALLGLTSEPRPDHAADALAVAICHANHAPLHAAVAG